MAKMPDTIVMKVVSEPVTQRCYSLMNAHDFDAVDGTEGFKLILCRNCGMLLDVRFENASGS